MTDEESTRRFHRFRDFLAQVVAGALGTGLAALIGLLIGAASGLIQNTDPMTLIMAALGVVISLAFLAGAQLLVENKAARTGRLLDQKLASRRVVQLTKTEQDYLVEQVLKNLSRTERTDPRQGNR